MPYLFPVEGEGLRSSLRQRKGFPWLIREGNGVSLAQQGIEQERVVWFTDSLGDRLQVFQIAQLNISSWNGELSQVLGVNGAVEAQDLTQLLHGRSPIGEVLVNKTQLYQQQDNARSQGKSGPRERAGLDLTCSAPKSVSIQALVFGDRQLEAVHRYATEQMLRFLEENYACTRIRQNGQRQRVQTGQLAIAQFHHDSSRALDPQLHSHNLILNLQQRPDGKWQSLDNEAIYRARTQLGRLYRQELARAVQALGYEVEATDSRHGFWELKGYTRQQLEQFSKRTQQIQVVAGMDATSEQKAWITMTSGRQEKQLLSRQQLQDLWQQEAMAAGICPIFLPDPVEQNRSDSYQLLTPREPHDFQRNAAFSAAPNKDSPQQHNSQSTHADRPQNNPSPISQFRSSLREIIYACQSQPATECLGRLETADSGNSRPGGAIDPVAEAHTPMPDYIAADAGESAAADRCYVCSSDNGGTGGGFQPEEIDPATEPEIDTEWELEQDSYPRY